MQKQPKRNRTSLYSKFKVWCAYHNIPTILLPIILISVLAFTALAVGGTIAGWNIVGILTSPTAILVYAAAVLATIMFIYYHFRKGR